MTTADRAIVGVDEMARRAAASSRGGAAQDSPPSALRRGVITAAGTATYTVDVLAADGSVAYTVPGVPSWGRGGPWRVGDAVVLVYEGERPVPYISAATSGAERCSVPILVSV